MAFVPPCAGEEALLPAVLVFVVCLLRRVSYELSSSGLLLYENGALGYWVMGVVPKPSFHRTHLGTQKDCSLSLP